MNAGKPCAGSQNFNNHAFDRLSISGVDESGELDDKTPDVPAPPHQCILQLFTGCSNPAILMFLDTLAPSEITSV